MSKNKLIFLIIFFIAIYYQFLPFSCKMFYSNFQAFINLSFLKDIICNLSKDRRNLKKILLKRYPDKNGSLKGVINKYLYFLININYIEKANIPVYTMMNFHLILDLTKHVKSSNKLKGDIVDVGVWKGGSSMIMKYYMNKNKKLYLLDLFDHMDSKSISNDTHKNDKIVLEYLNIVSKYFNRPAVKTSIKDVKDNFNRKGLDLKNVHFLKGNLNDKNFPYNKINKISLLRIDCDFYLPTLNVLKNLYHKVVKGGIIIFDDFNLPLLGEKQAALDFFNGEDIEFISVSQSAYMIKK